MTRPVVRAGAELAAALLVGLRGGDGAFDGCGYVLGALCDVPEDDQADVVVAALLSAVTQHAGTLAGLVDAGLCTHDDVTEMLSEAALARAADQAGDPS